MEVIDVRDSSNETIANIASSIDEDVADELDLVGELNSKACQIMYTGYKVQNMLFYFCSCDPDQKQPMCYDCYTNCHADHDKSYEISYEMSTVCSCGMNYHRITDAKDNDNLFNKQCLFMEWSRVSGTDINFTSKENNKVFCLFCANFCQKMENLNKNIDPDSVECSCSSLNHQDAKSTLKKLTEIRILKKVQLSHFTFTHMINLIINSENSFDNIFKNLVEYLFKLQTDMEKEVFNLDSKIGYSLAMKSLETLFILCESTKNFFYFSENFDALLDKKFVFALLEKKIDHRGEERNLWYLKDFIFGLYINFIFNRDFENIPVLSFKDIENLHPLQRLIFIKTVQSSTHINSSYFKSSNFLPLEQIINIIEKVNSIREKNEIAYDILHKCYKICRVYASYNCLSSELGRFCSINDDVISSTEADKKVIPQFLLLSQVKVIIQMVKSISYCVYYHNDEVLEKFLKSPDNDVGKLIFFHSNSYDAKLIYKNCINILNYVRNCRKSLDVESRKIIRKNQYRNTILDFKISESKRNLLNLDNQVDSIEKFLRKILVYATNITSIVLNNPENYMIGLRRLLQKDMEIYMNYMTLDSADNNEKDFFKSIVELRINLEEKFFGFFKFKTSETDLIAEVIKSLNSYKEILQNFIPERFLHYSYCKTAENKFNSKHLNSLTKNLYYLVSKDPSEKKELLKSENNKSKKKNENEENENNKASNSKREIFKYQILTSKGLFQFTIIKALKILLKTKENLNNIKDEQINTFSSNMLTSDEFFLQEIMSFLHFFVEDNPDNCMIMLSEDLLETFCLLDIENLYYFLDFLQNVLLILSSHEVHINSHCSILRTIKSVLNKISGNIQYLHLLEKIIKIVKIFTTLPCINQELKFSKLRGIMKIFFTKNPILEEFKCYLVSMDSLKNLKLIKSKDNYDEHKNNFINLNDKSRAKNRKISISEKYSKNLMNIEPFDENEETKDKPEVIQLIKEFDFKGCNIDLLFTIFYKFLKIINYLFDGNATLNENLFLSQIIKSKEIPSILRKKNIALQFRTEILKFFRMTDIDVIIDPENLENYRSIFVNNIIVQEDSRSFEDQQIYKLFNNLLTVNENCLKIGLESAVIKYELKFFDKIVKESKCKEKEKILIYFENGIILPLIVFINKFMSIIFNQTGYKYLKFYEIVVYFLKLKRFLIENIPKQFETETTNNKFLKKLVNYLKIKKNKFSLINKIFTVDDLLKLNMDIDYMCNPNFDILDYKLVHYLFEEHIKGFIQKPPLNSIIKVFDKRELNYSIEDLKKIDLELKQAGYLKLPFEKKIYETIINYENDKNKFSESSFIQNLSELNHIIDSNYRAIILKTTFFLVNDKKLSEKYLKQNFWNLFKLLQNDTNPTQTEIYSLYLDNHLNINFEHIVDIFLQNFLSIIFASCNPSTTIRNEDYVIAMTIIKILKYLCEDHNYNFQTIFFSELKFDCVNFTEFFQPDRPGESIAYKKVCTKVSLFELLLGIVGKIIVLAQWEKINFENFDNIEENNLDRNSSAEYFYDIFFAIIELLIEMVQGTTSENLEGISVIIGSPFFSFLQNVKSILLKDNHDSPIIYKVRKDLIEFIVSFLEEKSTPKKMINLISSIFNPFSIFDCIVNTLTKIYIKNNSKNKGKMKNYEEVIFDYKKCEYFGRTYFSDKNFCETPEFILANRLYQYVKLLSSQFKYEDAVSIINSIKSCQENDIIKYFNKKKLFKQNKLIFNENVNDELLLDDSYLQNYFAVKFFEKITRTVHVKIEKSDIMVLFTVNPSINFLSSHTKTEFYENVDRDTEYSKKLSLIETCDYFYDEIVYNSRQMNNKFYQMLNKINYFYAELALFLLTFIINIYLLLSLDKDEVDSGFLNVFPVVKALGSIQLLLNGIFLLAWFVSKFPLYYIVEKKKFCMEKKIGKMNEELCIWKKIKIILWYTIVKKSETNGFIWNIILSGLAISSPSNTFLFSIQLLSIINLSVTLHNIVNAVTLRYKQLLSTSMFMAIMLYFFSCLAFYFLSQDFEITHHDGPEENLCSSLLSCFLTHLDYGLRTDGGIGEFLKKISLYSNPGYFIARFCYEISFFIVMIIILLNIVFGMIIDTFAELREKTKQILNDKENICYICGGKRDYLEKNCISFDEHVKVDHSIWTYAEYIIGLKFVDPQETNAINSYVIGMIENKKISWFPSIEQEDTAE